MQIAIVNRSESEILHISKIQDGGRPPCWKSKIRNITSTVQSDQDETAGTCRLVAIVNRAESENLRMCLCTNIGKKALKCLLMVLSW